MTRKILFSMMFFMLFSITSCGQSGKLYLPNQDATVTHQESTT